MTGRLLVRRPGARLASGLVTHIDRQPVDLDRALRQWDAYVSVFDRRGWEIIEVEPADECPDAVFVEDAVVMFAGHAIVTSPGAAERRGEIVGVERTVRALGLPHHSIDPSARLDGGDVLKVGSTVYIGRSGRTDDAGIESMRSIIEPLGGDVVPVPVTKVLHLKSAVTATPDGTVIGWDPVVDDSTVFPVYRAVPEESGAHVVVLDPESVLMASSAPTTAAVLGAHGVDVTTVDISEFEKLEGCVTCLSVRIRS